MNPDRAKLGCSFKGAVAYISHDPQQATTNDRVSFTHCHNLRTDDPEKAAKIMAWTALHASDLKRDTGQPATGRKMEKPVYHLSLNWHPDEKPSKEEMIKAGQEALSALKMQDHEAVFAAHTDKAHQHLHIVVNRVHPEKGTSPSLSNDLRILQKWAYEYEKQQGTIQCKNREAIYEEDAEVRKHAQERQKQERHHAKQQGQGGEQKTKPLTAWQAQKAAHDAKANEIRTQFAGKAQNLVTHSKTMYTTQKQEKNDLYKAYVTEKQRLWKERCSAVSDVYEQVNSRQQGQWEQLKKQQTGEYASLMRSIRQADYERQKQKKPLGLFMSVIDIWFKSNVLETQKKQHQQQRDALSAHLKKERDGRIDERKTYHQAKADYARTHYIEKKKQMEQKHIFERQQMQKRWAKLNEERARAWATLKAEQEKEREEWQKRQAYKPPTLAQRYNATVGDQKRQKKENLTASPTNPQNTGKGRGRSLKYD